MIAIEHTFQALAFRQRNVLADINGEPLHKMVIMGCGELAQTVFKRTMNQPLPIECFCDNDVEKQGTSFCGKPVISVAEAVKRFPEAMFVVCIYSANQPRMQLAKLGCKRIASVATLCRHIGAPLMPLLCIDYPRAIMEQSAEVRRCDDAWADDQSRAIYRNTIDFHTACDDRCINVHDPLDECYWPPNMWTPNKDDHLVDCGAFDGDTVHALMRLCGGQFKKITAFEPDVDNYGRLLANLAPLTDNFPWLVQPVNKAVGETNGRIGFSNAGTISSAVVPGACSTVECVRLDDAFTDEPPSYIKMDLEGYELEAIAGARRLMREHAPIMAVTLYHRQEHLWRIPLAILDAQPDYRLFLRSYADDCWEKICYAVPPCREAKECGL